MLLKLVEFFLHGTKVIDFFASIKTFSNKDVSNMDCKELHKFLKDSNIKIDKNANYGNLIDKIFAIAPL